ncbi:unnamed protein product [Auanema sp. JU1783]|nr:unnamed protein product [Auanema sp. JU1783]
MMTSFAKKTSNKGRKKLFHSSALFSLFWSVFYGGRVIIFALTSFRYANQKENIQYVEWEVIQCVLSAMGILISLSLFNAYRIKSASLMIFSWLSWMFTNFMISLLLLHRSIFDLAMREMTFAATFNDILDLAHLVNAPTTIYFILVFIAGCFQNQVKKSKDIIFGAIKTPFGYRKLDKCEVLHMHEDMVDEEIVYYV